MGKNNNDFVKFVIRIQSIQINNFKNIKHGKIDLLCNKKDDMFSDGFDMLGIYGQNGSGKSAVIEMLEILKSLLSGEPLSEGIFDRISIDAQNCTGVFEFSITDKQKLYYKAKYEFTISKRMDNENEKYNGNIYISKEKLSYSKKEDSGWSRYRSIIEYDYESEDVFLPKSRFEEISQKKQDNIDELRLAKRYTKKNPVSFIFGNDVMQFIFSHCPNNEYKDIMLNLANFGKVFLFIIGNRHSGLINSNLLLPFVSRNHTASNVYEIRNFSISLTQPNVLSASVYNALKHFLKYVNGVLKEIIPDLSVECVELSKQLMKDGSHGYSIELVSRKNNKDIPLKYESDGILKVISILYMLILVYNDPSFTLAIDELDSGIFEYLLGELLKILDSSGKGQLIFTSHNLRPLEMLDKQSIVFTTINPQKRFYKLKHVKSNHNLRDFYYRDILLGGQDERLYQTTNNFEIDFAFKKASKALEPEYEK